MKQLELSLIGGAVADSVLNGKLAELHKENKELREKTKILQDKVDRLLNVQKDVSGFFYDLCFVQPISSKSVIS